MKIVRGFFVILVTLGVIFVLTLIGILVIPGTRNNTPLTLTSATAPVGSPEFLAALSHLTNAPSGQGDPVTLVPDTAFLPALLGAIRNASSSIDITDYSWKDGAFSDQVFTTLIAAAQRGVAVRVLFDSFGSTYLSKKNIQALEQSGGKVAEYHPFSLRDPIQYDERDHMRALVFDGKTAFFGSVGIADYWITDADGFGQWDDFMIQVDGTMAQATQGAFAELWRETTGEVLSGPVFYPLSPSASARSPVGSGTTTNPFISIAGLPSGNADPVRDTYMLTVLSAQKKLYIINAFIVPDQGFLTALEEKARAGVDVRILSPGSITIAPVLRDAWHADYEQLLEAGVKLYEYQPSMIHAKVMMADDAWSVVGSANLDNRSDRLNAENIMGIADPTLATGLDTVFTNDLAQSKQITLPDWQKQYGFFSKLYSTILLVLYKQF